MRAAPAVSVRCSGGLPWRMACVSLQALAAGAVSLWALQHLEGGSAWALVPILGAAALSWQRMRSRPVQLVFDGQGWTVDGLPGQPELMLDLGRMLLLRWRPSGVGRAAWVPCTAAECGPAWHALRVAVYAWRAPAATFDGPERPARD